VKPVVPILVQVNNHHGSIHPLYRHPDRLRARLLQAVAHLLDANEAWRKIGWLAFGSADMTFLFYSVIVDLIAGPEAHLWTGALANVPTPNPWF
jgi:hypothetical protein